MTDREKAVVMAYTGVCMLMGDKLSLFYQYIQDKLGRSIMTHELAYPKVQDAIKEATRDDFIDLCKLSDEPRLMTLEEVKQHNNQNGCVWFEQPTYNAVAAFVRQDEEYTEIISPYILGEPINHGYWSNRGYNKEWRCWTARPTKEQREKEQWDD